MSWLYVILGSFLVYFISCIISHLGIISFSKSLFRMIFFTRALNRLTRALNAKHRFSFKLSANIYKNSIFSSRHRRSSIKNIFPQQNILQNSLKSFRRTTTWYRFPVYLFGGVLGCVDYRKFTKNSERILRDWMTWLDERMPCVV